MNEAQISANWLQITGKIKQKWGMLTDDEMTQASGNMDYLVGRIQERYAHTKEAALHQVNEFFGSLELEEKKSDSVKELP
jgi:uncharacterized protein YjbJ (UPF0337 family)